MPSTPVKFTNGMTNADKDSQLWRSGFPGPDPTRFHVYFNDFSNYVAGDWTVTTIGAGANALVADEPFGALASTNAAADNDGVQYQLTTENFSLSLTKKVWFKTRLKLSDATQSDFAAGLIILDTTILGSVDGDGATDGIFFSKEDGDTNLDFNVQKDVTTGQSRATAIHTMTTSYVTLGFYYDGAGNVKYYVNEVEKGSISMTAANMPDTPVTVSFAILNGEAVAKVLTVDYVLAAIER